MIRFLSLILGPLCIIGAAYSLSRPTGADTEPAAAAPNSSAQSAVAGRAASDQADRSLVAACQARRESLVKRLGSGFASIVRRPFVLLGDVPASELQRQYRETIAPTSRALSIAFFDKPATEPIAIILLSGDDAYGRCASRLDGQTRAAFAGYYDRNERRIVINMATGDGTIAHELTHALAHFDFPAMPEWFDEGLASLHEESRLSKDRRRITGAPNWRGTYLLTAMKTGTLRSLESLVGQSHVRPDQQAVDYAHARYFCLFLQDRGLLAPFYRKFRGAVAEDPTGLRSLRSLFDAADLDAADNEFRAWAAALETRPRDGNAKIDAKEAVGAGRERPGSDDPNGEL